MGGWVRTSSANAAVGDVFLVSGFSSLWRRAGGDVALLAGTVLMSLKPTCGDCRTC